MSFALTPTDISNPLTITPRHGESIEVWAFPDQISVDITEADTVTVAHLTIAQAERLIANLKASIAQAKVLRS